MGGFGAGAGSGSTRFRIWCRAGQVQQGSGEGSGEGLEGFGVKPGQVQQGSEEGSGRLRSVQQGSGEGSGEGLGQVRFNKVREKVPEKVWKALVQSQVRLGGFGAEPGQVQ